YRACWSLAAASQTDGAFPCAHGLLRRMEAHPNGADRLTARRDVGGFALVPREHQALEVDVRPTASRARSLAASLHSVVPPSVRPRAPRRCEPLAGVAAVTD